MVTVREFLERRTFGVAAALLDQAKATGGSGSTAEARAWAARTIEC
jgi:hypothetical protein